MKSTILKACVAVSVVALFAAGCSNGQSDSGASPASAAAVSGHDGAMMRGNASSTRRGGFARMNIPAGDKMVFGTVASVSGSSLTVTMMNRNSSSTPATASSTVNVTLDSGTKYQGGTQSDLKAGVRVAGYGAPNADGSITAVSLQINPMFGGGRGGSGGGGRGMMGGGDGGQPGQGGGQPPSGQGDGL